MKRVIIILLILTLVLSMTGCGSGSKPVGNAVGNNVQGVLDQQMNDTKTGNVDNISEIQKIDTSASYAKPEVSVKEDSIVLRPSYDVDLTKLSSTMVYSEVYNMMYEPESYLGKTVRMNGQFAFYQETDAEGKPIPDKLYFACIIADATACCSQVLEFVLAGEHTYPDDYPQIGDDIVVSGIFETYDDSGYMYCHLVDAVFE